MLSRFLITSIALLAAISLSTCTASADVMLQSFTGGSTFATLQADGDTTGYAFTVNRTVYVTHLGFWDNPDIAAPIVFSHAVGLWTTGGSLLGTVTISAADPLTGDFRYEALGSPVQITAGEYVLGAFYSASNLI